MKKISDVFRYSYLVKVRNVFRYLMPLAISVACSCKSVNDKEAIQDLWNEYCISLASKDGTTAVKLVDKETLRYYEWLTRFIRHEDSLAIKKHFLSEELMILKMRLTIPKDSLMVMSGEQLMRICVDRDMFGEGFHKTKLSNLVVKGPKAKALLVVDTTKDYSFAIDFMKEDGIWKIAFMPLFNSLYPQLESIFHERIKEQGLSEDEFLRLTVMTKYDTTFPSSVWQPLLIDSFYLRDP